MKKLQNIIYLANSLKSQNDWCNIEFTINDKLGLLLDFDFSSFKHLVFEVSSIRHAMLKHSNIEKEVKQNQIALVYDDFLFVPDIVNKYDKVEWGGETIKTGNRAIKFYKEINNIEYIAVFEIRLKRKKLGFKTLYKKARRTGLIL